MGSEKSLSSPEEASKKERKGASKRGHRPHGAKQRKGRSSHEDTRKDFEHTGSEKSLSSPEEASRACIRLSSVEEYASLILARGNRETPSARSCARLVLTRGSKRV